MSSDRHRVRRSGPAAIGLGPAGRLLALDRDPQAVGAGGEIDDRRFRIMHGRFSRLAALAAEAGITAADGVLLDLGVSSPQLDEQERGFSFRTEGPLDMRMDRTSGLTAAQWLAEAEEDEIREVGKR